jgi:hypothetical protein
MTDNREELVPYLGERAVTLFAFSVADGYPAPAVAAPLRRELEDEGDDPLDPQVTEAERLLIDWGRRMGADIDDDALVARVTETFQPRLVVLLADYAAQLRAECAESLGR